MYKNRLNAVGRDNVETLNAMSTEAYARQAIHSTDIGLLLKKHCHLNLCENNKNLCHFHPLSPPPPLQALCISILPHFAQTEVFLVSLMTNDASDLHQCLNVALFMSATI